MDKMKGKGRENQVKSTTTPSFPGNISIRHYQGGDEKAIVDLWNEALPQDTVSDLLFRNRVLLDPNFDPKGCFIAVDNSLNLVGFLLAIYRKTPLFGTDIEPDIGWITIFFTHPAYRRKGIGSALFNAAETYLCSLGRKYIYISSYTPNYFNPGIDQKMYAGAVEFLKNRNYSSQSLASAMDKSLVGFKIPKDVKALKIQRENEGYFFDYLSTPLMVDTLKFIYEQFGSDWARAVREALLGGVSNKNFIIARKHHRVIGFACFGAYDNIGERFGPFGVHKDFRGLGLGKILLYHTLYVMRQNGMHNAWLLWTTENSPAGELYKRAGFTVTRRFCIMKKQI